MGQRSGSYLSKESFLNALRYNRNNESKQYCFILGSGASRSSGILTGGEMVQEWRNFLLEQEKKNADFVRSLCACSDVKWEEWETIRSKPDSSRDYFPLYELRYAMDPDEGEAYLTNAIGNKKPSQGYLLLSELLKHTRHNVVITTNFDHLTEKAFEENGFNDPMVLGNPNATDHLKYPMIVKVHGDHVQTPLNCRQELEKLNPYWDEVLNAIIPHYIPIIIGYSAGDHTLMAYLERCRWLRQKQVYWCSMAEKENDTIERFLGAGRLRYLVPMGERGFDGIMEDIWKVLMPDEGQKPPAPKPTVTTPQPAPEPPAPEPPASKPSEPAVTLPPQKAAPTVQKPTPRRKPLPVLSRGRFRALYNKDTIETLIFRDTLSDAPEGALDLSEAGNRSVLCWRRGNTLTIAGEGGVAAPKSCRELFEDWKALRTVTGAELLDTSQATDMGGMFRGCESLQTLEVGNWNTGNVSNMCGMFCGCGSLQTLEVGNWNTGKVKDTRLMFNGTRWASNPPIQRIAPKE